MKRIWLFLVLALLAVPAAPVFADTRNLKVDFGAVGDFVADDTAAVQAAFNWTIANKGVLFIPPGIYKITSQLTFRQGTNTRVHGETRASAASASTILRWAGAPGGAMLLLDGSRETEWTDFMLDAGNNAAIEPDVLVDIDKVTVGPWNSRENAFRRMLLRGGKVATVRISHTTTVNNEANIFEDVGNYAIPGSLWVPPSGTTGPIAYLIQNINAKSQQIIRGDISGKLIGVHAEFGSAHMTGTQIGGVGTWFKHGGNGESSSMTGCDGDSSRTFLEMGFSQTGPFIASGNRFVQGYDGPLFVFGDSIGPVVLEANDFASGGYRANTTTDFVSGAGPRIVANGNVFPNGNLLPAPSTSGPVLEFRSLFAFANAYYGPGNSRHYLDDHIVGYRTTGQPINSLRISGAGGFSGEIQAIASPTAQLVTNQAVIPFTTPYALTLINVHLLPGMVEGQEVKLINVGTSPLTLQDRLTQPLSKVALTSSAVTISPKQSIVFTWVGSLGLWVQTSALVTPL
jgi:hypothetical protein